MRWEETPTLFGRGPGERVYTLRRDDEGATVVRFGDGRTGARLPTGRGNVVAGYRAGLGTDGRVRAGTLTNPRTRPVGLRRVTNPGPASGGADPEAADQTRASAPNTVRTFGRVVSLRDFEDAALQVAGVGKARAAAVWDGEEQVVQLTVAGDEGRRSPGRSWSNSSPTLTAAVTPTVPSARSPITRYRCRSWAPSGSAAGMCPRLRWRRRGPRCSRCSRSTGVSSGSRCT